MHLIADYDTGRALGLFFAFLLFAGFLELAGILLLHFLMPEKILERYWKTPYFRAHELGMFTGTVFAPMRTIMLMTVVAFPRMGKKRNLTDVRLHAPRWFRVAATVLTVWIAMEVVLLLIAILAMGLHLHAVGEISLWPRASGPEVSWTMSGCMLMIAGLILFLFAKAIRSWSRK